MSVDEHSSSSDSESLLGKVAGEFLDRLQRGEQPQIEEYARRYPEIAQLIVDLFPAMQTIGLAPCDPANGGESTERTPAARPVPGTIGEFRILREIGRGGMGVVFEAVQKSMDRRVALKVLPFASMLDSTRLTRFKNEIRAAGTLDHDNIVSIFSVGEDFGVHYYAMQLVRGQSMARVIAQLRVANAELRADSIRRAVLESSQVPADVPPSSSGPAEPTTVHEASTPRPTPSIKYRREFYRSVADLGRQAALALQHAHERGVVHRDIKPANLLLDAHGHLWVSDFGLARIEDDAALTMTGDLLGTLRYMAPEQAAGRHSEVNHRADIYALGVTLYELVSLQPSFRENDRRRLLEQITSREPVSLRKLVSSTPVELATIISRAIEKDPADRYSTAGELAAELQRFLDDQPIRARPPTLVERAVKWSRRHSDMAWAAVAVLFLVAVGALAAATAISRLYQETHRQEKIARAARDEAERHRQTLRQELYSLDMQRAFEAWDKRWVDEVSANLAKSVPAPGESDLRDFSWYALDALVSHAPLVVMRGHAGAAREVAVHPDGRRIVSVGDDGTIRVWDAQRGEQLQKINVGATSLNALAISPDGRLAATGTQTLELWDLKTGQKVDAVTWHSTTIEEAAFSPDGKYVASGARNWHIHVVGLADRQTRRFRTDGGNESLAFTDDGRSIVGVDTEGVNRVRTWNIETGELVREVRPRETAQSQFVAVSRCGRRIAVGKGGNGQVFLCDAGDGRQLGTTGLLRARLRDIALAPNDRVLLAAGDDGILRYWRLNPQWTSQDEAPFTRATLTAVKAHQGDATSVAFLDADRAVSCGEDGLIKVWRLDDDPQLETELAKGLELAATSPGGRLVVAADGEGRLCFVDANGQTSWPDAERGGVLKRIAFSRNGARVAAAGPNAVRLWDCNTRRPLATFQYSNVVRSVALSPDGRWLAVTAVDGYTTVWNTATQAPVFEYKLDGWGQAVAFSGDGSLLALGGRVKEVFVFETDTWNVAHRLPAGSDTVALAFDPQTSRLASSHGDAAIRIWDLATGRVCATLKGHTKHTIRCLAFHPRGDTLVSGCHDDAIRVWHLPTRRGLGAIWQVGPHGDVLQTAFSPDGRDLTALVYDPDSKKLTQLAIRADFPADTRAP